MSLQADALKVADLLIGQPLCALASAFAAPAPAAGAPAVPPRRVLVIRPGGIGDAVLFIPMLRELRRRWPEAELHLLAERRNAGVLDGTGLVDEILLYDRLRRGLFRALRTRYDLVVDTEQYHRFSALVALSTRAPRRIGFGTNARRRLLTDAIPYSQEVYEVHAFLALAEAATGHRAAWDPEEPFLPLGEAAVAAARERLSPLGERPLVAIHPGASIPERRWPPERYGKVARLLAEDGAGVVILGGRADVRAARVIERLLHGLPHLNLAGTGTLAEVAAIVSRVRVYLSADTGVLHIAYAVGTPTVHLFGPGVLSKWGPPGRRFRSVAAAAPCSPCTLYGYTPPCCQGMVCMLRITPEWVFSEVQSHLLETGPRGEAAPEAGR